MPTYGGMHPMMPTICTILETNWPEHPELWIATDTPGLNLPNVIEVRNSVWANGMVEAMEKLDQIRGLPNHVLLLLEDLVPLAKVDHTKFTEALSLGIQNNLSKLNFPVQKMDEKYSKEANSSIEGLSKVPFDYPWYTSLQVAIWNSKYLLEMCRLAVKENKSDPWSFEHLKSDSSHFNSHYCWPTVFHGLHYMGNVQTAAIRKLDAPKAIKRRLLAYKLKRTPFVLWKRIMNKVKRIIKN